MHNVISVQQGQVNKSRASIAALYQEVTGALDDLANPEETSKRAGTQKERIVDKRQSLSSIGRDATSHWVVPQYNTVLQRLRSSDAFPPVHRYSDGNNNKNTRTSRHNNNNNNNLSLSKREARIYMNLDAKQPIKQHKIKRRAPPELEPHEKYQERETVLCKFAKDSQMTSHLLLSLHQHLLLCMLPSSSTEKDHSTRKKDNGDDEDHDYGAVIMLAHVFLREIGKLLPTSSLTVGLDEQLFVNFDINYVGAIDIREFLVELACCNELQLSIQTMTHILFLVYGRVQNNANTMQERVISSELIAKKSNFIEVYSILFTS